MNLPHRAKAYQNLKFFKTAEATVYDCSPFGQILYCNEAQFFKPIISTGTQSTNDKKMAF